MKNWKNGKIIYCPFLIFFLFWFGSATVASSSQLGHAVAFPPVCFVLADNMNGVLYSAVSVRNRYLPFQKRAHWKMLIVKMQMSKKWHKKIVNQDIYISLSWLLFLLRHPQHLALLRRRIELHTANNSSVHLKTL